MKRMGRRNRSFYRIVAADARAQRDGRVIERLGYYDPQVADDEKKVSLEKDRVEHWLGVGAQPTETVLDILKRRGIELPRGLKGSTGGSDQAKARRQKRKAAAGKPPAKGRPKGSLRKAKKAKKRKKAAKAAGGAST